MASSSSAGSASRPATVSVFGYDVSAYVAKLPPALQPTATTMLTAQFAWWFGHFLTVVYSLLFVLFRRNQPSGPSSYRWALLGTILSYAIVVYKAHVNAYIRSLSSGTNKNLATVAQGLVKDENAQYMLLAIMWYLNPAYTPLLVPYLTFSLFHVATYANKTLIPKLFPPSLQSLSPPLKTFVEKYQAPALQAIAYYEVVVIPAALLIGLIPRWVRLFTPILFGQFLLQRYHGSNTTKRAFRTARLQADKLLLGPSIPEPAKKAYIQARDFLERLGGGIRTAETPGTGPQPQAAPQPQPAPEGPLAEEKVSEKKSE